MVPVRQVVMVPPRDAVFPSFRSLAVSAGCLIAIVFLAVTIFLNIRDVRSNVYAVVCVEEAQASSK